MSRPAHVEAARRQGDTETLSKMGKKGAEVRIRNLDLKKAVQEEYSERRARDEHKLRVSTNEHILSPDGEDLTE